MTSNQLKPPFPYPFSFFLIMASTFLFFFSMHLLITPLPLYLEKVGAEPSQVGVVMGAFAITALPFRPWVGRLVDRMGRKPVMLAGSLIFGLAPLFYALAPSVAWLFLVRLFHGVGMAAFTTSYVTMAADLVAFSRRGEALGLASLAARAPFIIAPPLGAALLLTVEFTPVFVLASTVALLSLLIAIPIREEALANDNREEGRPGFLAVLGHRGILASCLLTASMGLGFGTIYTFLPLFGVERGIANVGPFFTALGLANIVIAMPLGRLSDRIGRVQVILPTAASMILALWGLGATHNLGLLVVMGCLYGLGFGGSWAALNALVVDEVPQAVRGTAVALLFGSFDLGIGLGSATMGLVAAAIGYGWMYLLLGLVFLAGVAAFLGLMWKGSKV